MSSPIFKSCYKCSDRKVGCHAICEKYKKEVEENELLKTKIKKENEKLYGGVKWK